MSTVTDLSPLRKFEVTGPDAEALLQYCLTRDIRKLSVGQVVYTAMCYENGGMIDDGTVFRLGQNNFRWIGGDEFSGQWLRQQAEKMGYKAWVRSSTDQLHNIAVQGPKSRDLLKEIIWTSPAQPAIGELEWFRFAVARIGHFEGPPIVVSRTGYTGELGYEIFCHPKDALAVFDAVWEAGQKYGLKPMGLEALDMVRIEAGLIFANYEFTSETDPFEAGIGFTVPLKSKTDDFIGKQALIQRKEHPRHKLVGLDIESNEAVGHGDSVYVGRSKIGVVTSSTRSPILSKNIALARVDVLHSEIGTEIEIGKLDGMQKRLPGRIVKFAHYDPEKLRPRSLGREYFLELALHDGGVNVNAGPVFDADDALVHQHAEAIERLAAARFGILDQVGAGRIGNDIGHHQSLAQAIQRDIKARIHIGVKANGRCVDRRCRHSPELNRCLSRRRVRLLPLSCR